MQVFLNSVFVRCNFCKPLAYLFCNWTRFLRLEIWKKLGSEIDCSGYDLLKRGDCLMLHRIGWGRNERDSPFRQTNRNSIPNTGRKTWSITHHLPIMIMFFCHCQRFLYLAVKIPTVHLIIPRQKSLHTLTRSGYLVHTEERIAWTSAQCANSRYTGGK